MLLSVLVGDDIPSTDRKYFNFLKFAKSDFTRICIGFLYAKNDFNFTLLES